MKVVMYRVDTRSQNNKMRSPISFERILFVVFIISFALLIIIQALLTDPAVRSALSSSHVIEGEPLEEEVFLYSQGSLVLKLMNDEPDPRVKVIINGDEAATFVEQLVEIAVTDGAVIEVDGSEADYAAEVAIVSKSDNIETDCVGRKARTDSNVRLLTQVRLK